uniref:Esterase, PHB depolymerase family n=1 Tax=Candidatus Kentrum sp. FM TaxID=2126340 RepID=A0A450TX61_9GAMM|nr:MAG: esterase, PHB depolymerase family [Candidatus Kentron sp. FM]VFJ73665.1 MAG: esterase, PHB depolymerase family [Candidatus Kentron sp. FM]VFK20674.1 MAG: esterase, PHB depolymerase family [Candidatus Kentron sp. FM]
MNTNTDKIDNNVPKIQKVPDFGDKESDLLMYKYVPLKMPKKAPLVVVLHGCGESYNAAGLASYAKNTGWIKYADKLGFALILPTQYKETDLLSKALLRSEGMEEITIDPASLLKMFSDWLTAIEKAGFAQTNGLRVQVKALLEAPLNGPEKTLSALISGLFTEVNGLGALLRSGGVEMMEGYSKIVGLNPMRCFQFYNPERRRRQATSILRMVQKMEEDYKIDEQQIYVTGLSGGAAMTPVMLALCPETFAGGATIAGLPYGCADNAIAGIECMKGKNNSGTTPDTAEKWGDLVRNADTIDFKKSTDKKPRISIWQGGVDPLVNRLNANELVEQWTNFHGISTSVDSDTGGFLGQEIVDDVAVHRKYGRKVGGKEEVLVESYTVIDMPHGLAVDPLNGCGERAPFILDFGICSTSYICKFWGLERV